MKKLIAAIVALLLAAGYAYDDQRDDRKRDNSEQSQSGQPSWFDSSEYLAANPDVQDNGLDAWAHYVEHGRAEKRPPYYGVDRNGSQVASPVSDLPIGDWIYIDDVVRSLTQDKGGDSNAAQDLVAVIAMGVKLKGTQPRFIGVGATKKGVSKDAAVKIIKASGLNIPVYEGANEYAATESELGNAIIRESKKGPLTAILGGPAGDLAWAMKNGAHSHNITLHALLEDTWNELGSEGMPSYQRDAMSASSRYVNSGLRGRIYQVRDPDYYHLLFRKNLPSAFKDTNDFINRNRGYKAWDVANSNHILAKNRRYNTNSRGTDTSSLRIADVLAMASYCGIKWNEGAKIMNAIQGGLDILKDRQDRGAVNNLNYTDAPVIDKPPSKPVDRSTFTGRAKVYVHPESGGTTNPLSFPQTATITRGELSKYHYVIKHTKDGSWKGKQYEPGRIVDGTDGVISYRRSDNAWLIYMFEYSIRGEDKRPKGWNHIPWIEKGDPVGLISSTNTRNGKWTVSGQGSERTNVYWTIAK